MRIIRHRTKRVETILAPPHLIEIQLNSYRWFLEEGLKELFVNYSPIYDMTRNYSIEFGEFTLGEPKYSVAECRERDMTFEAPMRVKVRLYAKDRDVMETEIYLGELPLMTDGGTFIINGRERVIVSQITRSPGVYFSTDVDFTMQILVSSRIIPAEGPWLEIESDQHNVIRGQIHQSKKIPITQLIKAFAGFDQARAPVKLPLSRATNRIAVEDIVDPDTGELLLKAGATVTPDFLAGLSEQQRSIRALVDLPYAMDNQGRPTINNDVLVDLLGEKVMLMSPTRDDLIGRRAVADIVGPNKSDKPIVKRHQKIEKKAADDILKLSLEQVEVLSLPKFVESTLEADPTPSTREAIMDFYRRVRPGDPAVEENARNVFFSLLLDPRRYSLAKVGRYQLNRKLDLEAPANTKCITVSDLIAAFLYMIELHESQMHAEADAQQKKEDDIDHLANKRVRSVGELLQSHLRTGFSRMEKVARERMTTAPDPEQVLPSVILSVKPISAAIKSFFTTSQLSTFMDQTNPLAELSNKRKLSALGPGGLTRQSAKLEVRDVHRSHYGRICPIETPEGPNIGLINQLTLYGTVDEYGFVRSPYRRIVNGKVTDQIDYLSAADDDLLHVAPADAPVDADGKFSEEFVQVRHAGTYPTVHRDKVQYMDVAPAQIFSVSTCMIPFVENDDANRALMGANMQRQGLPLIVSDAPLVHTGVERKAALDAPSVIVAREAGAVSYVSATEIRVTNQEGGETVYALPHMHQSNKGTCFTFVPTVELGQRVLAGQPIADGPTTERGELALGKNVLVAFVPWGGYNYEDAILVSERLLHEDVYTSIHLERYQTEATDTQLGPEEITSDIPNIAEEARRNLDEGGIIRIGAEVNPDDILVGKIAPKGQTESSAEQRLIVAIFGKKAEEMRDVSLRLPHGEHGYVIRVVQFARFKYECKRCGGIHFASKKPDIMECPRCRGDLEQLPADELTAGVNHLVRAHVATRRPLTEGDKMAGRHGNKGVISKIMPQADMPFMMDGTPIDIVLNPLGVPSRMNIGQVLELHLGLVAKKLGVRFQTQPFQGSTEEEILDELRLMADRLQRDNFVKLFAQELGADAEESADERFSIASHFRSTYQDVCNSALETLKKLGHDDLNRIGDKIVAGRDKKGNCSADTVLEKLKALVEHRTGIDPKTGKVILRDGKTGDEFDNPISAGYLYVLKLEHLAEEKIHARSIGPYSLVTQQPLGGKAQFGGQRFGEMEVWALEAYGAAHTLQEMLTIKSDDVTGRIKTYEAIIKGHPVIQPSVPESFKILVNELRALALKVGVVDERGRDVELKTLEDLDDDGDFRPRMSGLLGSN